MRGSARFGMGMVVGSLVILSAVAPAAADARVAVRLTDSAGRPVDGTVSMAAGSLRRSCRTTASRCTITAPAGSYTVTVAPTRGTAPPARTIRVPASGTMSLAVSLPASPAVQATALARPVTSATVNPTVPATTGTTSTTSTPTASAGPRVVSTPVAAVGPTTATVGAVRPATSPVVQAAPVAQAVPAQAGRNLGTGSRLAVQGSVLDGAGRPVDATITVSTSSGGPAVGYVRTTAGRFSMFDLAVSRYYVTIRPTRGTVANAAMPVGSSPSRVTFRVP